VYAREVLARRTSPPEISHLLLGRLSPPISKGHVAGDVPLGRGAIYKPNGVLDLVEAFFATATELASLRPASQA
jgi:hypothetical protein